jgi:hypothetical protein
LKIHVLFGLFSSSSLSRALSSLITKIISNFRLFNLLKRKILTSSTMYSIKRLNNQGVDLLVTGDSSGAMTSFKMAMDILKEAMINETNTTSCDGGLNQPSEEAALAICESPLTIPGLHGMPCYVYDHGIMIARTTNEETSDEMLSLYSAIVLFNMALTCHQEGRVGRKPSLKRASLFYKVTL